MMTAKKFLVRKLGISTKEAVKYIAEGRLQINGKVASVNQRIEEEDTVEVEGQKLQFPVSYLYYAYYKPRGIETTLNEDIPDNLSHALRLQERIFPVGRLDKESEGLLLLTNDGRTFNKIIDRNEYHEKEYDVTVNRTLEEADLLKMASGVEIMGRMTRPAIISMLSPFCFRIILTEGMNRQIRRMCYKFNYEVIILKRTRICNIRLGDLHPGQIRKLKPEEVTNLKQTLCRS